MESRVCCLKNSQIVLLTFCLTLNRLVASYEEATTILHLELSVEWPTSLPLPLSDQLAATIALIMRAAQAFAKWWHLQLYADSQLVREWKKKRRRLPGDSDDINNSS